MPPGPAVSALLAAPFLACPVTHQPLLPAPDDLVAKVNAFIAQRSQRDVSGSLVLEPLDSGLIRADGQVIYAVRRGIAVLGETAGMVVGP